MAKLLNTQFFITLLISISLSGCGFLNFGKKPEISEQSEKAKEAEEESSDDVSTKKFSAASTEDQSITSSNASNSKGAKAVIPPGALAVDADITMEDGVSLAISNSLPKELGVGGDNSLGGQGEPVAVISSNGESLSQPMSLSIPLPNTTNLTLDHNILDFLVVLFRVKINGINFSGILPRELLVVDNGFVNFENLHFGVFQAVYTKVVVDKKVEVKSKYKNFTQREQKAEPEEMEPAAVVASDEPETSAESSETSEVAEDNGPPVVPGVDIAGHNFDPTFNIQLTHDMAEDDFAELRYTLDGSVPDCASGTAIQPGINISIATGATRLLVAIACDSSGNASSVMSEVYTYVFNNPPTITDITSASSNEDFNSAPLAFAISDVETAMDCTSTYLSMTSSDQSVVVDGSATWAGSYPNCTVTLSPVANAFGTPTITIQVSDGSATTPDTFIYTVNSMNDAPTSSNKTMSGIEDTNYIFVASDFNFSDIDGDLLSSIEITSLVSAGYLKLNGSSVTLNQVISKADIDSSLLVFMPIANENGTSYDSYGFSVSDGTTYSAIYTMTMDISAINDLPTSASFGKGLNEDSSSVISTGQFSYSDSDGDPLSSVKIASIPTAGQLKLNGAVVSNNQVIPKTNLDSNELVYYPNSDVEGAGADSFDFKVSDGFGVSSVYTCTINLTPVNDAPVLSNSPLMTLTDINEDDFTSAGTVVAQILSTGDSGDPITDVDAGAVEGIAVTFVDNANGAWEYKETSGSWMAFSAPSISNALLLDDNDEIRFVPNANYNGPSGNIDFKAWDASSGSSGTTGDTNDDGGVAEFSSAIATASLNVLSINDAPSLMNSQTMYFNNTNEDDFNPPGMLISDLLATGASGNPITDSDGGQEGIALKSAISSNGTFQYKSSSGSWTNVGTVSASSSLLLLDDYYLRFIPDPDFAGMKQITFCAWDQSSGTLEGHADVNTRGGTTPFSGGYGNGELTINAINDPPTASANTIVLHKRYRPVLIHKQ
jgi:hypothetical protein